MANCKFCGKPAGFLKFSHPACLEKSRELESATIAEQQQIAAKIADALSGTADFSDLEGSISAIDPSSIISTAQRHALLVKGWKERVDKLLPDGPVSEVEEQRLAAFQEHFALSQTELDQNGELTALAKSAVLRDVTNGIIPNRCSVSGNLPNLQKDEKIAWAFPNSRLLQDKIHREFVGGSQGVSFRVVKGVYYHVGAFKGHSVESTDRILVDIGLVIFTNKNIYFTGSQTSLRLPYSKIVSFEPFSNGIGFWKDAANAKAQYLITGDGLFTYNLAVNLSKL